jgi:hypothetical protein
MVAPAEHNRSYNSRPLWLGSRWNIHFMITRGRNCLSAALCRVPGYAEFDALLALNTRHHGFPPWRLSAKSGAGQDSSRHARMERAHGVRPAPRSAFSGEANVNGLHVEPRRWAIPGRPFGPRRSSSLRPYVRCPFMPRPQAMPTPQPACGIESRITRGLIRDAA